MNSRQYMNRARALFPYIVICLLCTVVFFRPLNSLDELWNYSFAHNISLGMTPYRDFNMVQTPLSAYISSAFISLLGGGLFSYRIAGFILLFALLCMLFKVVANEQDRFTAYIILLLSFTMITVFYRYDYNGLSLLIIASIIRLEQIKTASQKNGNTINQLQGLLIGIAPLIKQNTGTALFAANIGLCIALSILGRISRKSVIIRIALSILPSIAYVLISIANNTFTYFWEYTVEGIGTFTQRFTPLDLLAKMPGFFAFFAILLVICALLVFKTIKRGKDISNVQLTSLLLALAFCSIMYPLCDAEHVFYAIIPFMPTIALFYPNTNVSKGKKYTAVFVVLLAALISIVSQLPEKDNCKLSDLPNYELIPIDEGMESAIKTIDDYIIREKLDGYNVRIADSSAAAIKIPLNDYEKGWDMLLIGNLGTATPDELLAGEGRFLYLVSRNGHRGVQSHDELIEFIVRNYTKIDSIEWFDVYKKPE